MNAQEDQNSRRETEDDLHHDQQQQRKKSLSPHLSEGRKGKITSPSNPPRSSGLPPFLGWTLLKCTLVTYSDADQRDIVPRSSIPMRSQPERCIRSKFCSYPCDHGHTIDNCNQLWLDIVELIQRGHMKQYVSKGVSPPTPRVTP